MSDRRNRVRMGTAVVLVALVVAVAALWRRSSTAPLPDAVRMVVASKEERATLEADRDAVAAASLTDASIRRVMLPASSAEQGQADYRERAVLAVLGNPGANSGVALWDASFESEPNELGCPRLVPRWHMMRDGWDTWLNASRAKQLARELFAAYGLDAKPNCALRRSGVEVLLDGYDETRKVGFKLCGKPTHGFVKNSPSAEDPSTDLTGPELQCLEAEGIRLDVADLSKYASPLMEESVPMLAYLAGIVSFLDAVTSGPDVDLRAVLGEGLQRFPITGMEGVTSWRRDEKLFGPKRPRDVQTVEITTNRRAELYFDRSRSERVRRSENGEVVGWEPQAHPMPTRGAPCRLDVVVFARGPCTMHVTQERADGTLLECSGEGASVLVPSTFDVTRPFTVSLDLLAGRYTLDPYIATFDPRAGEYLLDPYILIGYRVP